MLLLKKVLKKGTSGFNNFNLLPETAEIIKKTD